MAIVIVKFFEPVYIHHDHHQSRSPLARLFDILVKTPPVGNGCQPVYRSQALQLMIGILQFPRTLSHLQLQLAMGLSEFFFRPQLLRHHPDQQRENTYYSQADCNCGNNVLFPAMIKISQRFRFQHRYAQDKRKLRHGPIGVDPAGVVNYRYIGVCSCELRRLDFEHGSFPCIGADISAFFGLPHPDIAVTAQKRDPVAFAQLHLSKEISEIKRIDTHIYGAAQTPVRLVDPAAGME